MNSNFGDTFKPTGVFHCKAFNIAGDLLWEITEKNLIVNGGRDAVVKLVGGSGTDKNIDRISFGDNGSSPLITDTAITNPYNKAVAAITYPSTETVQFDFTLELAENNGVTIREFGLLCVDGTLFSRKIRAAIAKTSSIRLEGFWALNF